MLKSNDYNQHTQNIRVLLKEKCDYMLTILEQYFSTIVTRHTPQDGFFVWLTFNRELNIKKLFIDLASKEHILINPGYIYGSNECSIRLSYAYEIEKNIKYALQKLRQYVDLV